MTREMRTALRTAQSSWDDRDTVLELHFQLVHPHFAEWMSTCGYDFLSYETRWEPRPVTCVWCLAGLVRNKRRR